LRQGPALPRETLTRRANRLFRFSEVMSSPEIKNISLLQKSNWGHIDCHPVPGRGALAIVANEGRVAVDAEAPLTRGLTRTTKACGPDASVLASSSWDTSVSGTMVARKPITRESALYVVKPLRRECRMLSAALYARVRTSLAYCTRGPRVQRAPGIPCAL